MASLLLVLPFIILLIINLPFKWNIRNIVFYICILMSLVQISIALTMDTSFIKDHMAFITQIFNLNSTPDNFTYLMILSIAIVFMCSVIVGRGMFIKDDTRLFNYLNLMILILIGMNGVVLVNDIFTMYVFLEITAVSSFILIALEKKKESIEGAFKYFLLSAIATVLLLISISLIYFISSGTSFVAVNNALSANSGRYIHLAMIVFFVALFIKGGIVPFHGWLPDAYSTAPNSVSVLLAGIVTKVTGIYTIIRLCVSVFHADARINTLFLVLGAVSVVFGALSALTQTNFKRMLAYSSISQIGYIILGLGTGTILGMAGAVFHLFNHSVFKSLLFINSAAVEDRTGTENLNELGGLQAKMPVTSITSLIAFLSTAGIPPLSGFWSKLIIVVALWQSGNVVFAFIAVIASVITLAYFLNLQRYVFFGKLKEGLENVTEAKYEYVFPAVFLALITICAGVFFHNVINTIIFPFGFKL